MKFSKIKYCFIMAVLIPFSAHGQAGDNVEDISVNTGAGSPYTFSISSFFGIKYGHAEEIVYKDSGTDAKLSQLLWNIKPLFYWGAAFDFFQRNPMARWGFFANATLQAGLPARTGVMEDRDWMAAGGGLSHFSSHDNYTEDALFLDISAGSSIPIGGIMRLKVFAGLSFMSLKWMARDGYFQYASKIGETGTYNDWDSSLPKVPVYGPGIHYQQDWLIFSPGIAAHIPLFERFDIGVYFKIGPVIFCYDLDDHLARNLQFSEFMYGGIMLEPKGVFAFSLNERVKFSLDISYRFMAGARGDTEVKDTNTNIVQTSKSTGGSSYSALDAALSVTLVF
ncbi:MAG: omptin family outer membrane protease [Spirochaetaceae bacterium]|jgi:outer membrane protease|nr:omptin family outer membrane protease [Spirochaetaceae bacterium]